MPQNLTTAIERATNRRMFAALSHRAMPGGDLLAQYRYAHRLFHQAPTFTPRTDAGCFVRPQLIRAANRASFDGTHILRDW